MKKISLITLAVSIVLLFACCASDKPEYTFNGDFSITEHDYSLDEATADGLFVINGDTLYSKDKPWNDFYFASQKGRAASFRVLHKIDGVNYYSDLLFDGEKYSIYKSDDDIEGCESYKYLLSLTGKDGNPEKEITLYVLSDTETLTFDDVLETFYSSILIPADETTPRWEWLGFTTYLK